jgi:hypothetical protein
MKNRCLPACIILRNIALVLALVTGSVMLGAEIHAAANHQQQQSQALRRLFVYQILVGFEQQQQQQ